MKKKMNSEEVFVYSRLRELGENQLIEDIADACNMQEHVTLLRLKRVINKGYAEKHEEFTPYGLLITYTAKEL